MSRSSVELDCTLLLCLGRLYFRPVQQGPIFFTIYEYPLYPYSEQRLI